MIAYVTAFILLAAESTSGSNQSNTSSVVFVAIVGGISAVVGAYFAYKGQKKQSDTTETVQGNTVLLDERKQLAEEWKTLREYKDLQLTAARKEIDNLNAQIRGLENELDRSNALINQLVLTLNRTGLSNLIPAALQMRVDANNSAQKTREQDRKDL